MHACEQCSKPSDDSCQLPFSSARASAAWVLASAVRCAMAGTGASATIRLQGHVLCASYHDFEYAQAFPRSFRKDRKETEYILTSARPSAVLP